ncbi:protein kinase [Actinophytocola sp. NPDC049390]|uniref:serine/threonine-protein kinase n=1 Tax=Actinophytocola sp. NPDC049390 TaxID=3363894 RepID=UPI0037B91708
MDDQERWTRVLPLGAGAFGEVHLAWDRVDERWVALKRFTGQDELGLLRFVIESRIRVQHPHLVRTLAFRLVDDRAWLVTELARGGSLRSLMASYGALPVGWVTEAVDQVLRALEALHATGVVHRDLKPANLLLRSHGDEPPHLLVGDFGIATWRTVSMTGIGAAIGTPGYLAPEYLDGTQPSPATDLFAVGVLAAELLAGRRLVHYSNASPDMPSSWTHTVPLPDEVPGPLAAVLFRMADPDPARRYTDCTQARQALLRASPPGSRSGLTSVPIPDLLASVPPGWTADGPEAPTTHLPLAPTAPAIDGGATALVTHAPPVATPANGSAAASGSATPPPGLAPTTPPRGEPARSKPARQKTARRTKRKLRRAVLLLVALLLAGGAGALWWAATHRDVPGTATAAGQPGTGETESRWEPEVVEPCSAVDIAQTRANGTERCQRTRDTTTPQSWVKAPPDGFPVKSDPSGPFVAESCQADGDTDYSPVGDHLYCENKTWTVIA